MVSEKMKRFFAGIAFYAANHIVANIPSFRVRHCFYRRVLGYRIGRNSSIHMNVFFTGFNVTIGENVVINRQCYIDGRVGVEIKDNVGISPWVYIASLDHDPASPAFETRGAKVVIENHSWISAKAIIMPGVTIGEGAVIGAGAVVTRNIAPFRIAVGVPAREIKDRTVNINYKLRYFTWFDTDVLL
jgi:acetyltransferase-like isoleucine patch superfamily enzyme